MELIFKSKLYRESLLRAALYFCLVLWATIASTIALRKTDKTVLIGISANETKLITDTNDVILKDELRNFLRSFLLSYYSYSSETYAPQMDKASNLMSQNLWERQKDQLAKQVEALKQYPLTQSAEITNIDQLGEKSFEAQLNLRIQSKLAPKSASIRVQIKIDQVKRTELNPWGYEVTEVSDVAY